MKKIFCIFFFLALCLLVVQGKEKEEETKEEEPAKDSEQEESEGETNKQAKDESAERDEADEADEENEDDADDKEDGEEKDGAPKEFVCNLRYQRIGCYADKGSKKEKALKTFLMSDSDMGSASKKGKLPKTNTFNGELPKFACKCANEALTSGSAIFGLQNIAECWSGPDDSKYDRDGPSDDCVTFDFTSCLPDSEICAGKKHANFMYFIDTPDHTKTQEEIDKELTDDKKKQSIREKKLKKKEKKTKKSKNKGKKSTH